jgi:hypothetical protein
VRGFQIDHRLELGRLLDGQIRGCVPDVCGCPGRGVDEEDLDGPAEVEQRPLESIELSAQWRSSITATTGRSALSRNSCVTLQGELSIASPCRVESRLSRSSSGRPSRRPETAAPLPPVGQEAANHDVELADPARRRRRLVRSATGRSMIM